MSDRYSLELKKSIAGNGVTLVRLYGGKESNTEYWYFSPLDRSYKPGFYQLLTIFFGIEKRDINDIIYENFYNNVMSNFEYRQQEIDSMNKQLDLQEELNQKLLENIKLKTK